MKPLRAVIHPTSFQGKTLLRIELLNWALLIFTKSRLVTIAQRVTTSLSRLSNRADTRRKMERVHRGTRALRTPKCERKLRSRLRIYAQVTSLSVWTSQLHRLALQQCTWLPQPMLLSVGIHRAKMREIACKRVTSLSKTSMEVDNLPLHKVRPTISCAKGSGIKAKLLGNRLLTSQLIRSNSVSQSITLPRPNQLSLARLGVVLQQTLCV